MSNEELCLLIQEGHDELVPELWNQCLDHISMMAGKYVEGFKHLDESVKDDCIQEAYFGFLDAVRLYKEGDASFKHYLNFHLKNGFRTACCGGRSKKKLLDPMNNSLRLDAQMKNGDGEGCTLADLVADKEQGQQTEYVIQPEMEAMEEADYWQSVNGFMHRAFDGSSDETGKQIYKYMLDHDCGFRDAIIGLYGEDAFQDKKLVRKLETRRRNTRRDFMKYWNSGKGKEERRRLALDEAVVGNGLRSYGLKRYIEHGYTSFVESIVISNIDDNVSL